MWAAKTEKGTAYVCEASIMCDAGDLQGLAGYGPLIGFVSVMCPSIDGDCALTPASPVAGTLSKFLSPTDSVRLSTGASALFL